MRMFQPSHHRVYKAAQQAAAEQDYPEAGALLDTFINACRQHHPKCSKLAAALNLREQLANEQQPVPVPALLADDAPPVLDGNILNEATLLLQPLDAIKEEHVFVAETGHKFDMEELAASIRTRKAFYNPYTGATFSASDSDRIIRHKSKLGLDLRQFACERPALPVLRPEIVGALHHLLDRCEPNQFTFWLHCYFPSEDQEILDTQIDLRNPDGGRRYSGTLRTLLVEGSRPTSWAPKRREDLKEVIDELCEVARRAAECGVFRDTFAERYEHSSMWTAWGIDTPSEDGFFTPKAWDGIYQVYHTGKTLHGTPLPGSYGGGSFTGGIGKK